MKQAEWSQEAYANFRQLALDKYDFTTCQRPDGSYYGTGGQCRKGTETEKPEKEEKKGKGGAKSESFSQIRQRLQTAEDAYNNPGTKEEAVYNKARADAVKKAASVDPDIENRHAKYLELEKKYKQTQSDKDYNKFAKADEMLDKKLSAALKKGEKQEEKAKIEKLTGEADAAKDKLQSGLKGKEGSSEQLKRAAKEPPEYGAKAKTPEAQEAARLYTKGNSATNMNNCSRGGNCSKIMEGKMKKFDTLLKDLPANSNGESHFRGMVIEKEQRQQLLNLKPGQEFRDKGYSSFSRDPAIATKFASTRSDYIGEKNSTKFPVIVESKSKSLRNIERMSEYQHEQEAVLPRGTTQKVSEVKEIDGVIYMYVE